MENRGLAALPKAEAADVPPLNALVLAPFVGSTLLLFAAVGAGATLFGALCALSGLRVSRGKALRKDD